MCAFRSKHIYLCLNNIIYYLSQAREIALIPLRRWGWPTTGTSETPEFAVLDKVQIIWKNAAAVQGWRLPSRSPLASHMAILSVLSVFIYLGAFTLRYDKRRAEFQEPLTVPKSHPPSPVATAYTWSGACFWSNDGKTLPALCWNLSLCFSFLSSEMVLKRIKGTSKIELYF